MKLFNPDAYEYSAPVPDPDGDPNHFVIRYTPIPGVQGFVEVPDQDGDGEITDPAYVGQWRSALGDAR